MPTLMINESSKV